MKNKFITIVSYILIFFNSNLFSEENKSILKVGLLAPLSGEYKELGDIDEIAAYNKRAAALDAKLIEFDDVIDDINNQEELLDWDTTQFPAKAKVKSLLDPYLKMYVKSIFRNQH